MTSKHLILGPPGTGKTTYLLDVIDRCLEKGVHPTRIAYYSFTRAATLEAQERASKKFGFKKKDLEHFRTLHSESWRALSNMGYTPDLLTDSAVRAIGVKWQAKFLRPAFFKNDAEAEREAQGKGDVFLHFYRLCRALQLTPEKFRRAMGEDYFRAQKLADVNLTWTHFKQFYERMREVASEDLRIDFPDLIDLAAENVTPLDLDIGIVDEAQDLSSQQWKLVDVLLGNCTELYFAGDDDQAIYQWSGADISRFRTLGDDPNTDITVLNKSWRLPRKIFEVAQTINHRIKDRYEKDWGPREEEGEAYFVRDLQGIPFDNNEPWLVLARNAKYLTWVEANLRARGFSYAKNGVRSVKRVHWDLIRDWTALTRGKEISSAAVRQLYMHLVREATASSEEAERGRDFPDELGAATIHTLKKQCGLVPSERDKWFEVLSLPEHTVDYYRAVLRKYGASQLSDPLIRLHTIHAVKGAECDNVVLLRSMSAVTWDNYLRDPDSEHRVFYVGATRAKKRLYVVRQMQKAKHYYRTV